MSFDADVTVAYGVATDADVTITDAVVADAVYVRQR